MRKLFARVTGGSKREHDADVFDTSSLLSPTFQSVVHAAVSREDDLNSPLISAAAQSLLDDIQEILYDTASLQDNTSGFDRLLHLLNSVVNNASVGFPRDTSPLETLLINLKHPLFSEKCNEVGLSTALMHALRLLRMYEIKIAKYSSPSTTASTMTPVQGVTFTASKRLCLVFSTLLSDQKSTEQIRQSLVKLVTFPLSALPEGGIHLQVHSASIISGMCAAGLTLQQISFFHDVQAVTHMVRSLDALSSISEDTLKSAPDDHLLRGISAEAAGMWLVGVSCLVDVISSSTSTVNVLMDEFEAAGGRRVFVQILLGTAEERLTPLISTISRLFFDPKKPEIVSQPSVGGIFIDYLRDLFELRRGVSADDDLQSLHDISSHLVTLKGSLSGKEYVIQRIGYTLLTIYSNDPANCDILEENYHFLSLLVISLPALEGWDSISAILTTLNYVCQCIDTETELPILALCAAISVMTRNAIYAVTDTERERFLQQLDATCSSFEAIIRGQAKYAILMGKYGVLKWILCDPLVDLDQQLESGGDMILRVYIRVIDFIISIHKSGPPTGEIIHDSGLIEITYRVISANNETNILPIEISRRLLMLLEGLVNADFCHLEEVMRFLMKLLNVLVPVPVTNSLGISGPASEVGLGSCNVKKITFLCHTFSRIIEGSKEGYSVWSNSCGVEYLISMMNRLQGVFIDAPCSGLLHPNNQQPSAFMIAKSSRSLSARAQLSKSSSNSRKNLFLYSQSSSNSNFDISQIDDPFPGQIIVYLDILVAITDCISTDFGIFKVKNKGEKDFDIIFTLYRRNYTLLANSLIETNIFSSAHAEWGIRILFGLLKGNFRDSTDPRPSASLNTSSSIILRTASRGTGTQPLPSVFTSNEAIVNPEAIEVIVESLHRLPVIVSDRIIETLQTVAEESERDCQSLCEADACLLLIKKFYPLYSSEHGQNPLCTPLFNLIKTLMIGYLRAKDFSALLYHIVRPDVLADPKGFELPLPWSAVLESTCTDTCTDAIAGAGAGALSKDNAEKWKSLELLLELQKKDIVQAVPHIILGGITEPYMIVQLAEPIYFPPNAFTFSLWLKLQKEKIIYDGLSGWCIPILSLSGGTSSFLEVHWEIDTRLIRVMVNKRGSVSVIHFLLPINMPVDFFDWNLLVITVHAKKLPSRGFMKSAVCLFLNGLPCPPVGAHTIAIDIPADNVDICVGRFIMDAKIAHDEGTKEELNIISSSLKQPLWGLGPILLWDESLSNVQLSLIFLRGPTYTGIFQGESPLTDHLSSISCCLLRKCDLLGMNVEEYVNDLGLKGLERVVDPPMERLTSLVSSFDLPVLPPAMLAYSPESAISTYTQDLPINTSSSGIFSTDSYIKILLPCNNFQSGINTDSPPAIIKNSRLSRPSSLSSCVSTYGGPNILFPMLESAVTEDQLIGSLKLIRQVTLGDSSNLKYMQTKGYKILAFILYNKNKNLITSSIIEELFKFSVSYGKTKFDSYGKSNLITIRNSADVRKRNFSNGSNNCNDTLLLVDTPALYYLLLNHQIWSIKRSSHIQKVVNYLEQLSSNSIHGDVNSQRLAILGAVKWCLMGLVHVIQEASIIPSERISSNEMKVRDKDSMIMVDDNSIDSIQLNLCDSIDIINETDTPDPYLSSVCAIVKRIILSEVQKRDLDLISSIIIYTFNTKGINTNGAKKNDMKEREKDNSRSGSSSRVRISSADGAAGNENDFNHKLSPLAFLRVYLFRLVFSMYDESINKIIQKVTATSGKEREKDSDFKKGYTDREKDRIDAACSNSATLTAFRVAFCPEWFVKILEKSTLQNRSGNIESATQGITLKLLALMLQSDNTFVKEFCYKDGMKYLRNLLPSQANLGNVLPLLGMLFRIPIKIIPLPSLFFDDDNSTQDEEKKMRKKEGSRTLEQFIDLKECSGPDLSDVTVKEYTLPLLEIILECLTSSKAIAPKRNIDIDYHHKYDDNNNSISDDISNNISNNDDNKNDNGSDSGNQIDNIDSNKINDQIHKEYINHEKMKCVLRDTILKSLSHGFFSLYSFRLLMQKKKALQDLLTSLLFYHDSAAISNDKLVHFDHSLTGSNLPGELNENHFSLRMTSSPSIDKNMNNSNFNSNNDNNNVNRNGSNNRNKSENNLSSPPTSNFANRKLDRNKLTQKSDTQISENESKSDISSPTNPTNNLFKGSPNWENLFESTPDKFVYNNENINDKNKSQNQNQSDENTHLIATERESLEKYFLDEGKKLLTLISSIIFSGIIELENPSMIAALFLCLPSDDLNNEKHQLLIIDCFKNVVNDIFTDYYDNSISKKSQKVLSILSGVLNHLINLSKLNFFVPSVKFELLQLTLKILQVSYEYKVVDKNKNFLRDKEKEKERISALSISKDLGETGRCFACSCLQIVEDNEMKKFRKRNECLQGDSRNVRMLPPHTDHTNLIILQFIRKNLGLLLQPNLFTDKEDFIVTPLIVIRTTKKEKDLIDDKPSGISLSLDSFRMPWVAGPEELSQGSSKRSSGTYVLDTYATLAVTLAEKQKTSEAFCMILLKRCMHLIAPFTPNNDWSPDEFDSNSKDTRGLSSLNEYCKILTFILIHRQALFEHLFCRSHSQSIQNQGSSSQHGQQRGQVQVKGRGGSIHKDEDIVEEARLEAGRFLLTGLQLLLPRDRDYMAYELYLQGESGSEESAERQRRQEFERAVRFCAWFSSNRNQTLRGLSPLVVYVLSTDPDNGEGEKSSALLGAANKSERSVLQSPLSAPPGSVPSATSVLYPSPVKRLDEIKKICDQITMQSRRWMIFGFVHIAYGGIVWRKGWNTLQAGPIWGYEPLSSYILKEESLRIKAINESVSNENIINDNDNDENTIQKNRSELRKKEGFVKRWSLVPIEGPDRSRIRMQQEYGPAIIIKEKMKGKIIKQVEVLESAETVTTETIDAEKTDDMEGFLKEITQKGFLRKTSVIKDFDYSNNLTKEIDNELLVVESSILDSPIKVNGREMSLGDVTDRADVDSDESDSDESNEEAEIVFNSTHTGGSTDSEDLRNRAASTASELLSGWYFAPKEKIQHESQQRRLKGDTEVSKRSAMLLELVKGIIGIAEWHHGKKYNVQRISGLESQSAILVITHTNLHILTGFRVKSLTGSGGHKINGEGRLVVEWVASVNDAVAAREAVIARANASASSSGTTTRSSSTVVSACPGTGTSTGPLAGAGTGVGNTGSGVFSNGASFDKVATVISSGSKESSPTMKKAVQVAADAAYAAAAVGLGGLPSQQIKEEDWLADIWKEVLGSEEGYRCMPLDEVYTVFRRRHQLKYTALRVTDTAGYTLLFSCESEIKCDEVLLRLFEEDLPASLFYSVIGIKNLQLLRGLSNMYNRLMALFLSSATSKWLKGEVSNFDYLMHLNVAAGRSFQDLTQYPVFPWILSDYSSEILDLEDPRTYRDLSKPMGALGLKRAKQYRDRFRTMDDFQENGIEGTPPPFYYGTHYSCAGYVLHYLLRLQPYSNMAIALQGGYFDKADRLFTSIEQSWLSASSMNLQDVRELIPEFFCVPDFLVNKNKFDLGTTQKGDEVDDVQLPVWAKRDPIQFIRIHREALESKYVSNNLHDWIDLIFGCKQRGAAAEEAMNVFIHLTYDGEVDVDAITDPFMRDATIAQINNFGQTPTKLFDKPHPKKMIPDLLKRTPQDVLVVDASALLWHEQSVLTPPLCMAGAPHLNSHIRMSYNQAVFPAVCGVRGPCPIGDIIQLAKDKLIALPSCFQFLSHGAGVKTIVQFGGAGGGISIHSINAVTRSNAYEDRESTYHESLHQGRVTCICTGRVGTKDILGTGSVDGTIRLWCTSNLAERHRIEHLHTMAGHTGAIVCTDFNPQYHILLSGSADCTAALWDVRSGKLLRILGRHDSPILSVSINPSSGHLAVLSCAELRMYSINGDLLGCAKFGDDPMKPASSSISSSRCPSPSPSLASGSRDCLSDATDNQSKMKKEGSHINLSSLSWSRVVLAPPCPGWQDGIVAVTGHDNGLVCFWRLQTIQTVDCKILSRELVPSPLYLSAAQSAAQLPSQFQTAGQVQKRIQTHPYTHNAPIIVLKLSPIMSAKSKDLTEKNIQSGPLDLLVGDEKGYVSAWTLMKLDQFSPVELSLMTCLKPPPPRDTHAPSSTTGSTSTLVGAANSFVPLGAASGLLKLLGAGVMASTSGIHTNQTQRHHETASALAARIQEIEDLSNDDHMEEFF